MRYQNGLVGIVTLILAALTMAGALLTNEFPQASQAESVGFDALAHELLDDLLGAAAPTGK